MALVQLKDVGKIYVSDGNVSVGIRGVNLSFDRGEFVAVTGKSGSGKSTLLNVISGMDSYEEGELYINGEPTSHYAQEDWELFRKKYISFIFQDYNIVESFTVLQNVELALMHIDSVKERREKALELIRRVGLEEHVKHKGSQLSGGQKQRTVIARALAKDSPILLADEPTGNLDSQSSQEVIELLREISHDKLVMVVTHNFDQVEAYATRHIRIFDGAVEFDHELSPKKELREDDGATGASLAEESERSVKRFGRNLKNGMLLGRIRFSAKPKFSLFLCILFCLSTVVASLVTALSADASVLFDDTLAFNHIDGRMIVIRQDGHIPTREELEEVCEEVGADTFLRYDYLLEKTFTVYDANTEKDYVYECTFRSSLEPDVGRAPEKPNEIMLSVPIGLRPYYGEDALKIDHLNGLFDDVNYTVVGIHYFYDNTKPCQVIFSEEGFEYATAFALHQEQKSSLRVDFSLSVAYGNVVYTYPITPAFNGKQVLVSFDLEDDSYTLHHLEEMNCIEKAVSFYGLDKTMTPYTIKGTMNKNFQEPMFDENGNIADYKTKVASLDLGNYTYVEEVPSSVKEYVEEGDFGYKEYVVVSPDVFLDFMEHYYSETYTQASLFFADDEEAQAKAAELRQLGYVPALSDTVAVQYGLDAILQTVMGLVVALAWLLSMLFIAMFLNLCSNKAMLSSMGDIAIMRSMGIPVSVIKISVYTQTLLSLLCAFPVAATAFIVIYTTPKTNNMFSFMGAWEYVAVAAGVIFIALRMAKRYVKKMFGTSVKKTLRGEVAE